MPVSVTVSCLAVALSPSLALAARTVFNQPINIIIFAMAAFFWLVSILLSSVVWLALSFLWQTMWPCLVVSVVLQEAQRVLLFEVLKRAQTGLAKFSCTHPTRQRLAAVCGLGAGMCACLLHCMNPLASVKGEGGMLAVPLQPSPVLPSPHLPLIIATEAALLSLSHVAAALISFDALHRRPADRWWLGVCVALASRLVFVGVSGLKSRAPLASLSIQALTVAIALIHSYALCGGSINRIRNGFSHAIKSLRHHE